MSCPVCIESYTQEKRRKIHCDFCDYVACHMCVKRYILESPESPHCMNCNKSWGRVMLSKKFSQSFMNTEFKWARENILLDRENSMIQATQPYIEVESRKDEIIIQSIEIKKNMNTLARERRQIVIVDIDTKRVDTDIRREIAMFELDHDQIMFEYSLLLNGHMMNTEVQYQNKCCRETCAGFLNNKWKCVVCSLYTCKECREPKDSDTHVCDPNSVETVKHLAGSEYKKCPTCSMSIFKTEGCLQMFCVSCKTAFNWRTGQIVTGRIHNPHYYEYMRQRGQIEREIGDVQCGGLPNVQTIANQVGWASPLIRFHRLLVEFYDGELGPQQEVDIFQLNLKERVKFITKKLSRDYFKIIIQQRDKMIQKKKEIGLINTTFIQIMSDIYGRLDAKNSVSIQKEIVTACEYVNGLWTEIGKAYSCVVPNAQYEPRSVIVKNMKVY